MPSRRDFMKSAGVSLTGAALQSFYLTSCTSTASMQPKLSVQLYTIRQEIEKDAAGALKRLAGIGFSHVETAFWPKGISLNQGARLINENGFQVSSAHIEIPTNDYRKTYIETAKAYGCTSMIWHGWPEDPRYSTLEGTFELVKLYKEAAQFSKDNGLRFGLHNHWWEFRNNLGGSRPYEILLEELGEDVFFELDTYWIKVAGLDPAAIIRKFGTRAKFLHIKDGPAQWHESLAQDNPDPMTAVGKGSQDMPAILQSASENHNWLVVEMDKVEGDVFEKLKESYDFLMTYSKG